MDACWWHVTPAATKWLVTRPAWPCARVQMWDMKCETLTGLAQRVLEYDRLITERVLHKPWALPELPLQPQHDAVAEGDDAALDDAGGEAHLCTS